jgi:hypothetical protein
LYHYVGQLHSKIRQVLELFQTKGFDESGKSSGSGVLFSLGLSTVVELYSSPCFGIECLLSVRR